MSQNPNTYNIERHVAEIYDQRITEMDDVALLTNRKQPYIRGPVFEEVKLQFNKESSQLLADGIMTGGLNFCLLHHHS